MNTRTALEKLLASAHFPHLEDVPSLVGRTVRLRIHTDPRRDAYDIVGTTIASARIHLQGASEVGWLELTFPRQSVSSPKKSLSLELVCARYYLLGGWCVYARRTGWRGLFGKTRWLDGTVTCSAETARFAAAA